MQFFPANIFSQVGALAPGKPGSALDAANLGVEVFGGKAAEGKASFQDIFASLRAYNENNTPGAPLTTRSTRDDNSFFKSDEYAHLKGKLDKLGVSESIVNEYFGYLSTTKGSPGIATLRSSVAELKNGRLTAEPDKQEFTQISTTLSKMDFSNEEIAAFEQMMHNGDTLGMLKMLKEKVEALAGSGLEVEIGKNELDLIIKACDLSHAGYDQAALTAWASLGLADGDKIALNKKTFGKLFGATIADFETRDIELDKLAENINAAIESMLEYRKTKNNEPVADMRGSALSERSETMSRILATLISEEGAESEKAEENSTSHLMEDKNAGKAQKRESIVASLADDKMTAKAVKEERRAEAGAALRGENPAQSAQSAAQNATQNAAGLKEARENALRAQTLSEAEHAAENAPRENMAAHGEKARPDLSNGRQGQSGGAGNETASESRADKAAFAANVREDSGVVFGLFGRTENSSASAQDSRNTSQSARTEMYHERIFNQIERGIIRNAADGSKQIVLRLDPPELGKLTLSLTMAQGEVKAVIRTESAATTQVVSEQLAQLKQSLEEQGFKVSSLEVETRPQSHAGTDSWSGAEQHNQEREMLEQARFLRLARARAKEGPLLAQTMQHMEQPASISASGLHIIA